MRRLGFFLLLMLAVTCSSFAEAHALPLSYSFWIVRGADADVELQIATSDLAALGLDASTPGAREAAGRFFQQQLVLEAGSTACIPTGSTSYRVGESPWTMWRFGLHCTGTAPRRISIRLLELLDAGHRHLLRIDGGEGHVVDQVLDESRTEWVFDRGAPGRSLDARGSSLFDYVRLGIEHLLTGWDHMVFLLALLVLARRLRDVVALVTSFTIAHSTTLALATLGLVQPNPAPVEALIGFSIALLGAENAWLLSGRGWAVPTLVACVLAILLPFGAGVVTRVALLGLLLFCCCHFGLLYWAEEPAGLRVAIAFAFGLIHGFGFAGVMVTMDLPPSRLALALLGFNVGVEIGQLAVVLVLWPLLRILGRVRGGRYSPPVQQGVSAAICGLGLFWFLVRGFG